MADAQPHYITPERGFFSLPKVSHAATHEHTTIEAHVLDVSMAGDRNEFDGEGRVQLQRPPLQSTLLLVGRFTSDD